MRHATRLVDVFLGVAAVMAGLMLGAPTSYAHASSGAAPAVFVQTNDLLGNAIVAFHRDADGTLTLSAVYPTGGDGGREVGAMSDPLASQGSLVFDSADRLLFAVNAGSNTVSVFGIQGNVLHLQQVIASGGSFPVGFALHGNLLYVLNAGLAGDVSGFRVAGGQLHPIAGSARSLGLANTDPPFFLSSPAEVGFTPSGSQLVVTTKTNGTVDVFAVERDGRLSNAPVKNAVGGVPFAFRFEAAGQLALVRAANGLTNGLTNGLPNPASGSLETYIINPDGTLTAVSGPVSNGQTASCWITEVRGFDYIANTGSGTISQYTISSGGTVTLVNATAASGLAGPTDLAAAGNVLYNQGGLASSVYVFAVDSGGALTLIQNEAVPDGTNQEGIVAI